MPLRDESGSARQVIPDEKDLVRESKRKTQSGAHVRENNADDSNKLKEMIVCLKRFFKLNIESSGGKKVTT